MAIQQMIVLNNLQSLKSLQKMPDPVMGLDRAFLLNE